MAMTYAMVIDLKKCVGCHACTMSCKDANATPPGVSRARVERELDGTYPDVRALVVPTLCMHCEKAPCVENCPTGASVKREDGIVTVDKSTCSGCKTCITVCPYKARSYIESNEKGYFEELTDYEKIGYARMLSGTVDKCDFCLGRAKEGEAPQPACVKACPGDARIFGTLDDLMKMVEERSGYQLLAEQGTNPSVYYLPKTVN